MQKIQRFDIMKIIFISGEGRLQDGFGNSTIQNERMYVENANRAASDGYITENRLEPIPKNPVIASFFRNIGYADQLGSGVRNLFKYSKYYSGQLPEFIEGDIFRIIVPLDEEYSSDFGQNGQTNQSDQSDQTQFSEDEIILLKKGNKP